jgi:hypothetical protein
MVEVPRIGLALGDRLRHSLIDRFVEPGQIRQIGAFEAAVVCYPLLDHARPQGSIFRDHLIDVEAVRKAEGRVYLCRALAKRSVSGVHAARLIELFGQRLRRLQVRGDELENIDDVVFERELRHPLARR